MAGYPRLRVSTGSPYEPRIGISRAIRSGTIIAISGTAPLGPDGKTVAPGNPELQTRRCLQIIREALEKAGATLSDVTRTRIMLKRIEDWESVAKVHGEFFSKIRPASTCVQVTQFIDPEWLVEIEADAVVVE
jgi:enamine deaminase RidA (YjgF/YER057c/UK114 family)